MQPPCRRCAGLAVELAEQPVRPLLSCHRLQVFKLLTFNYVEDDDEMFRCWLVFCAATRRPDVVCNSWLATRTPVSI